ncbi:MULTISPECIES: transposase [Streptomyces albovinaceus subgroup]|uniref:transposase n=1 Tax=Streptomyces mediolani TaxID=68237 RepID=UPI002D21B8D1|nr:transposase [Streptomyces mediolani]
MAGLTCYKPGKRSRMFYSVREYRGRKGEPKGIGWRDLCELLVRAHIQLGSPIVLVWDNLRMHLVEAMRQFIADHADWLTVFQLPSHSPDVNPQEGIWSLVKRDIGNLAAADLGQITRAVKRRLKQIQYRPGPGRRLPGRHRPDHGRLTGITNSSSPTPVGVPAHGLSRSCCTSKQTSPMDSATAAAYADASSAMLHRMGK